MGELSALKHNVQPSVFHEFLIVDRLGLLLLLVCLFFFLFVGHVLLSSVISWKKTQKAFQEFTYYKLKLREQEMCFIS